MTRLVLAAASGLAREVLEAVRAGNEHEVIGVVDDDPRRHGDEVGGVPVLGGPAVVRDRRDVAFVLCAGRGSARERMAARLGLPDERYATIVHPSVLVPPSCSIGPGSVLLAGTVLTAAVRIGRHVVVMPNATLTHDDVLEDHATICAGVALGGGVTIGAGAYVGMAASVRENLHLGAACVVAMGAAVIGDVPAGETWAGVPARPLDAAPRSSIRSAVQAVGT